MKLDDKTVLSALEAFVVELVKRELGDRDVKPANDYLTPSEAAAIAKVSPATIRRWVRRGELTRHEAGSRVRVRRAELEKFLSCEVTPIDVNLSPAERARRRFG